MIAREWFVLQGQVGPADYEDPETSDVIPAGTWRDYMSLSGWEDPALRASTLAGFRDPVLGDPLYLNPYDQWRMVRRTEEVLPE